MGLTGPGRVAKRRWPGVWSARQIQRRRFDRALQRAFSAGGANCSLMAVPALSGCAFSSQTVKLAPKVDAARSKERAGAVVGRRVLVERSSQSLDKRLLQHLVSAPRAARA